MPRHIFRLVLIMVGFIVLAVGAKRFFTVDSFYQYGHYRGDSVAEIASDKPKYKGTWRFVATFTGSKDGSTTSTSSHSTTKSVTVK